MGYQRAVVDNLLRHMIQDPLAQWVGFQVCLVHTPQAPQDD